MSLLLTLLYTFLYACKRNINENNRGTKRTAWSPGVGAFLLKIKQENYPFMFLLWGSFILHIRKTHYHFLFILGGIRIQCIGRSAHNRVIWLCYSLLSESNCMFRILLHFMHNIRYIWSLYVPLSLPLSVPLPLYLFISFSLFFQNSYSFPSSLRSTFFIIWKVALPTFEN